MSDEYAITSFTTKEGIEYSKTDMYVRSAFYDNFLFVPVYVATDGDTVILPLMSVRDLPIGARLVEWTR